MVSSSRDSESKHVYLLHGFIGSGKTTFARILAKEVVAMRLTHDEYMVLLYGTNPPEDLFRVYYDRVTEMIWKMTVELIQLNVPVILDFGFWTKESRLKAQVAKKMAYRELNFFFENFTLEDDESTFSDYDLTDNEDEEYEEEDETDIPAPVRTAGKR